MIDVADVNGEGTLWDMDMEVRDTIIKLRE